MFPISTLDHEIVNDSMKLRSFVPEAVLQNEDSYQLYIINSYAFTYFSLKKWIRRLTLLLLTDTGRAVLIYKVSSEQLSHKETIDVS